MSAFKRVQLAARAGRVVHWAWRMGPGLGGAAGLSAACGGLVQTYTHQGGAWAGIGLASLFALAIDLRGG